MLAGLKLRVSETSLGQKRSTRPLWHWNKFGTDRKEPWIKGERVAQYNQYKNLLGLAETATKVGETPRLTPSRGRPAYKPTEWIFESLHLYNGTQSSGLVI
jgi:hypothetical protein